MQPKNANLIQLGKRPKQFREEQRKRERFGDDYVEPEKRKHLTESETTPPSSSIRPESPEWKEFRTSLDSLLGMPSSGRNWSSAVQRAVTAWQSAIVSTDSNGQQLIKDSDVAKLLMRYTASCNEADQGVLFLITNIDTLPHIKFQRFTPLVWSDCATAKYADFIKFGAQLQRATSTELLNSLDPKIMWHTLIGFPLNIRADMSSVDDHVVQTRSDLYDMRFMLAVLLDICSEDRPLDCRLFVCRNCLSLLFAATSAHDDTIRAMAYAALSRFRSQLKSVGCTVDTFPEKSQYIYMINLFKNSLHESNQKIDNVMSHFLARMSKVYMHPEDIIYSLLNQFMLLKPKLCLQTVPEFFKMFESDNPEKAYREKEWILQLLADSLRTVDDYKIMQKSSVFKQLMVHLTLSTTTDTTKLLSLRCIKTALLCAPGTTVVNELCSMGIIPWMVAALGSFVSDTRDVHTVSHFFDVAVLLITRVTDNCKEHDDWTLVHCSLLLTHLIPIAESQSEYVRGKWLLQLQQLQTKLTN